MRRGLKCEYAPPRLRWAQSKTVTTSDLSKQQSFPAKSGDRTWSTGLAADFENQESTCQYLALPSEETDQLSNYDGQLPHHAFGIAGLPLNEWDLTSTMGPIHEDSKIVEVHVGATNTHPLSPTGASTSLPLPEAADGRQSEVDQTESHGVQTPTTPSPGIQWSPGTSIDDIVAGPDDKEDDEVSEDGTCWQFDNPSLGDFMEPLFDDPGEHIAFMYCKSSLHQLPDNSCSLNIQTSST